MFTTSTIPSTSSVLSMYSTFAATTMLVRTVFNEVQTVTTQLIPRTIQTKLASILERFFSLDPSSSQLTLFINEYNSMSYNELYQASEAYLSTRIDDSIGQLRVSKDPQEESLSVKVNRGQKIRDVFNGFELVWEFVTTETQQIVVNYEDMTGAPSKSEHKMVMLSFHKQHKEKVLGSYLPQVMKTFKATESSKRYVRLYAHGNITGQYDSGPWSYINLDHPSTFETLAMDPTVKKEIIDDLDRFVRRREFYRRVGKPWKRGYLLYGPPGTGKSSLVAAVANYLKFDVYDLELGSVGSNGELRRLLTGTANRSIVVIEDIDCSVDLQDRGETNHTRLKILTYHDCLQLTLSGLLNFIDGLWSSCGDERIIIFTTNHKEKLDPALLRPGRMDMHIHMSYCNPDGFRILASNYLKVESHKLFGQIEQLIEEIEATPAEIAEELMKGEDADAVLEGVVGFLQKKRMMKSEVEKEHQEVEKKD
ncbi:AAA-ATPase At3g50940 [Linum perenne]